MTTSAKSQLRCEDAEAVLQIEQGKAEAITRAFAEQQVRANSSEKEHL